MPPFGAAARDLFLLRPGATFLNHGSFGATPAPVHAAQQRWRDTVETQPDLFFRETIWTATRASAARVGRQMGAPGESLVFLPNVTEAVAVVLDAIRFAPGDEIVLLDVAYAAVRKAAELTAARTGAGRRSSPDLSHPTKASCSAARVVPAVDGEISPTAPPNPARGSRALPVLAATRTANSAAIPTQPRPSPREVRRATGGTAFAASHIRRERMTSDPPTPSSASTSAPASTTNTRW